VRGDLYRPETKDRVLRRLAGLGPESRRQWGRMTPHQAICHLADAFDWAAGRRPSDAMAKPPLPPFLMRLIALRLPFKWPKGVRTMPETDQMKGGTAPMEFESDRERLKVLIDEFARWETDAERPSHPIFKTMGRKDWGRWGYRHMDHHLRQFGC